MLAATALAGCRQDMQDQPKFIPLRPSGFFADGRSERPLIEGTVARGHLNDDTAFYTGKGPDGKPLDTFPFAVTTEVVERGQDRFNVYCAPCHDRTGSGNGMIVQRGYRKPPSYHIDRLRQVPNGYLYDVITQRIRRHAGLRRADCAARPLGHRGLHPRAAIEPERRAIRRAGRAPAANSGRRPDRIHQEGAK